MGSEHLVDTLDDENDFAEAVNDDHYGRSRPSSRADTLRARRRVEALLEERRLRRAIEDDWAIDEEEE
ncbi:PA3496 family putative envelope integrity protein [Halomonas urumqiensis]|nr:hypothetical protein [Halomonas urumqiensis]GHE20426.1 hypothetical protein GCM10017767_09470 [Halomonas urumqiensis]